ncbi:MAG: response regulator transcription factor [Thermomicrobium sp.]|nr:response regulator transcription factor [Thermomicrobium sp.]
MEIGLYLRDEIVADIIELLLERRGHRVIRVSSVSSLLRLAHERVRVIIFGAKGFADGNGHDGLALCARLRDEEYRGGILILTRDASFEYRLACFEKGVDDVFPWPGEPAELLARLEALARRAVSEYPGVTVRIGDFVLDVLACTLVLPDQRSVSLSPTETRVLECLIRNAGIVIPRDRLIERVWGYDYGNGGNRLEVVIRRLRRKLEADPDRPQFLRTIRGVGYVFRAPRPIPVSLSR